MPFVGRQNKATPRASHSPSAADIGWVAGFLEGEGSFGRTTPVNGNIGGERVTVRQKDIDPLHRLQQHLGGTITKVVYHTPSNLVSMKGATDTAMWNWGVYGVRARGVMLTVFSMMSDRRKQQILHALGRSE